MAKSKGIDPALTTSQVGDVQALLEADAVDEKNKSFLRSLCDAHKKYNGLTPKQAYWMDKLFNEMLRVPPEPKDIPLSDQPTEIPVQESMNHLKEIVMSGNLYFTLGDRKIKCYYNKKHDSMTVCHRQIFPSYYGAFSFKAHSITYAKGLDSEFKMEMTTLIRALVNKPKETIAKYGIASGSCGMCGKELTDPVSIELGIGPVCKKKLGFMAH